MGAWIATALAVAITAMSAAVTDVDAGSCAPVRTHNCLNIPATMDFSSVPEISKQIAGDENTGQKQKQPTGEPPPTSYTGPIFGTSPRPGRMPIVGYSWSLE
jgi:hypothetical protein